MMRQHAAAAGLFLLLSVVMTWPLAANLGSAVSDPGDPYVNVWALDWDWWATLHQPLSLFHANSFHPAKYSLALSENIYGIAVFTFPLRAVGAGPVTAFNLAMLAGFAFCGFAAYLVAVRLTGSFAAGLAAGVFYAFVPWRFVQLPHIQHVWGGWLPLLLYGLLLYAARPTPRRAALFAAFFVMNGLTSIHALLFGGLASALTAALLIPRRDWKYLGVATAVAMLVLTPFLYPYAMVAKLYGLERTYEETLRFSATPADWLPGADEPERRLYPGALALIAAVVALVSYRRPATAIGAIWVLIGFLGSLGPNFEFHRFLFGAVPGFRAIRVPARWASITYVGLAVLIAVATAALARKNRWLTWLVPAAFVAGLWHAPIRWYLTTPNPPVYRWLAREGRAPIAELPLDTGMSEYRALFRATAHHRPVVNGPAGTPVRNELSAKWAQSPLPDDFLDALSRVGVSLLVIHADDLGGRRDEVYAWLQQEVGRGRLGFVKRFDAGADGDLVFRLGARGPWTMANCPDHIAGALDFPATDIHFRGEGLFSGWAISPHGIRGVDLLFENGAVRLPATLRPASPFPDRCRRFPGTRYLLSVPRRPEGIRAETDVQVEVTDGRGVRTRFEPRWMRWE